MNSDNYKIVISISHHRIAFEYWQRDGEDRLMPISNIAWPVPLAFYCSPMGIEIGEVAVRAVNTGTSNAFDDYFEKLASDETYILGGRRQPLRYLLLDAAEAMFEDFFKNDLFGSKGAFKDNRATMPVTLACEADIRPNERALVASLFRESGYNRFKITEYNDFIERYVKENLAQSYPCKNVLVAWTEGSDLSLTLFDLHGKSERHQVTLPGLGVDPRLDHVKHLIWDRIKGQNPWLTFETEEEAIERAAMDFLASEIPMLKDTLILSDGNSYHYSLNRAVIDNLQCDEGAEIKARMEDFLRRNGVSDKADTLLILRGMASGNIFFEQTLCPGFREIIRSDRKLRDNVMQLLIADPNPVVIVKKEVYSEPIELTSDSEQIRSRKPTMTESPVTDHKDKIQNSPERKTGNKVESESEGRNQSGFISEFASKFGKSLTSTVEQLGNTAKSTFSTGMGLMGQVLENATEFVVHGDSPVDTSVLKKLNREWREVRALARGKVRAEKYEETLSILSDFLKKCRQEKAEDLAKEVITEIEQTKSRRSSAGKKKNETADKKVISREGKSASGAASKPAGKTPLSRPTPHAASQPKTPPPLSEARSLIVKGKLKEARDWYREKGNSVEAKLVGDVIRAKKSADMRIQKSEIEQYRKSNDAAKAKRVVEELEDFIKDCERIGYPAIEYKQALEQYRKMCR